jgi:hypothetical protein
MKHLFLFLALVAFYTAFAYSPWFALLGGAMYGIGIEMGSNERLFRFHKQVLAAGMMQEYMQFIEKLKEKISG